MTDSRYGLLYSRVETSCRTYGKMSGPSSLSVSFSPSDLGCVFAPSWFVPQLLRQYSTSCSDKSCNSMVYLPAKLHAYIIYMLSCQGGKLPCPQEHYLRASRNCSRFYGVLGNIRKNYVNTETCSRFTSRATIKDESVNSVCRSQDTGVRARRTYCSL